MKFSITHSCGHPGVVDITGGKASTWKWQAGKRAEQPCQNCGTEAWTAQMRSDNATHAAVAAERGWPQLVGTAKQIEWATTIRGEFLDNMPSRAVELDQAAKARGHEPLPDRGAALAVVQKVVLSETSAAWWIQNRRQRGQTLCAQRRRMLAAEGSAGESARRLLLWADTT